MNKIMRQTHRWLGLTAGLVLAVVGFTGAMLSFERDILLALNPQVAIAVAEVESTLPPRQARPEVRKLMREAQVGRPFFRGLRSVHRYLAAGRVGKQIVGASTVILIVLCLSGLYLRWPARRRLHWRSWFWMSWKLRGRAFLWQLHAVSGTIVLLFYLLAALTGLYWSYDWYRKGLFALFGEEYRLIALSLHSGAFFGIVGKVTMMLACALMPLFAITGWMHYLKRNSIPKGYPRQAQ